MMKAKRFIVSLCCLVSALFSMVVYAENISVKMVGQMKLITDLYLHVLP